MFGRPRGGESPENDYEISMRDHASKFDAIEDRTTEYSHEALVGIFNGFSETLREGVDQEHITLLGRFTYLRELAAQSTAVAASYEDDTAASYFENLERSYADMCLVLAGEPPVVPTPTEPSRMSGRKQ